MDLEQLEQRIAIYGLPTSKLDIATERMVESMPPGVLEEYQIHQINRVLEAAQSSVFWSRKLESVSFIEKTKEMEKIPITTREEINELSDRGMWGQTLTVSRDKITHMVTSGYTGLRLPFVSGMTEQEYSYYVADIMRLFFRSRVKEGDTLLNVFPGKYVEPEFVVKKINQLGRNLKEYKNDHIAGTLFRDAGVRYGLNVISTGLPMMAFKKSAELAKKEALRVIEIYKGKPARILATSPQYVIQWYPASNERK